MHTMLFHYALHKLHRLGKLIHVTLWPTVVSCIVSGGALACRFMTDSELFSVVSGAVSLLCWWVSYCRGREYYLLINKLKAADPVSRRLALFKATEHAKSAGRLRVVDIVQQDMKKEETSFTAAIFDIAEELIGKRVRPIMDSFTATYHRPSSNRLKRVLIWLHQTFTIAPY